MVETKVKRRRTRSGYVQKPRAVHLTLYSPDGEPVSRKALGEAAAAVEEVAIRYGLLGERNGRLR
jgi:hypothetical protein